MRPLAAVLLLGACTMPAPAARYVDNPAFCDAPAPEQELADLVTLRPTGIDSHGQSCTWDRPLTFVPGLRTTVTATCDDGASQWQTPVTVTKLPDGSITAPAPGLPDRFFACSG